MLPHSKQSLLVVAMFDSQWNILLSETEADTTLTCFAQFSRTVMQTTQIIFLFPLLEIFSPTGCQTISDPDSKTQGLILRLWGKTSICSFLSTSIVLCQKDGWLQRSGRRRDNKGRVIRWEALKNSGHTGRKNRGVLPVSVLRFFFCLQEPKSFESSIWHHSFSNTIFVRGDEDVEAWCSSRVLDKKKTMKMDTRCLSRKR